MKLIKLLILSVCVFGVIYSQPDNNDVSRIQEYYSGITKAAKNKKWWDVIYYSKILFRQHSKNEIAMDVSFHLASAYFHVGQYELANRHFSEYLLREFSPKYYEEAISYKFQIAKSYYNGTKKAPFGTRKMIKFIPAKEDALIIFEEVLNALPNSEIAIDSLFYKGKINAEFEDYKESIESFQTIIRKYPKHERSIDSFLAIGQVFLKQADPKHQDPNLIDMAQLNLNKFEEAFPKEERISLARENFNRLQEIYAKGLYEIGRFYERTKKTEASEIYYRKIISAYPGSNSAKLSEVRLSKIKSK